MKLQQAKSFEEKLLSQQSALANRVVNAILAVFFLLTGTQFFLAELQHVGYALLAIAGILIIRLWTRGNNRMGRRRRRAGSVRPGFQKPRFHP